MKRRKKNKIITDSTGTYLLLHSRKYGTACAYFDPEDIQKIEEYTWGLVFSRTRRKGAELEVRATMKVDGMIKTLPLQRHLMPVQAPMVIDHIDQNPLNYRKSNLRAVTPQQNQFNRGNTRGYSWCQQMRSYRARIILNKKFHCLGYYQTERDAKAAYLKAKAKLHII